MTRYVRSRTRADYTRRCQWTDGLLFFCCFVRHEGVQFRVCISVTIVVAYRRVVLILSPRSILNLRRRFIKMEMSGVRGIFFFLVWCEGKFAKIKLRRRVGVGK